MKHTTEASPHEHATSSSGIPVHWRSHSVEPIEYDQLDGLLRDHGLYADSVQFFERAKFTPIKLYQTTYGGDVYTNYGIMVRFESLSFSPEMLEEPLKTEAMDNYYELLAGQIIKAISPGAEGAGSVCNEYGDPLYSAFPQIVKDEIGNICVTLMFARPKGVSMDELDKAEASILFRDQIDTYISNIPCNLNIAPVQASVSRH